MLEIKTENQKLRDQIGMDDAHLLCWLQKRRVPFDLDGAGKPWLTHERLLWVISEIG